MTDPRAIALEDQFNAARAQARRDYTEATNRQPDAPIGPIAQCVVGHFRESACCVNHTATCGHFTTPRPSFGHAAAPNMLLCGDCWAKFAPTFEPKYCSHCHHELTEPGHPDAVLIRSIRVTYLLCRQCHTADIAALAVTDGQ